MFPPENTPTPTFPYRMSAQDSSKPSQTDWDHLADPSDDGIDYSDVPPLDEVFFRDATLRIPHPQEAVTVHLDATAAP